MIFWTTTPRSTHSKSFEILEDGSEVRLFRCTTYRMRSRSEELSFFVKGIAVCMSFRRCDEFVSSHPSSTRSATASCNGCHKGPSDRRHFHGSLAFPGLKRRRQGCCD